MTQDEFDNTIFNAGMTCIYKSKTRDIVSVEFDEQLIGLRIDHDDEEQQWVRCENIKLIE